MTTDDHDGNDQRKSRGDTDKPSRDAKGRWRPGYCPNPKGRPKKKPKVFLDTSDIRVFGNTLVDVVVNGQKETMDRSTALLNKMFESAMKGRVSMQRFLYREFERTAERLVAARLRYDQLLMDWIINNPDFHKRDFDLPFEVDLEIAGLRTLLDHYYPGQYPLHAMSANDDSDDDDSDDDDSDDDDSDDDDC